MTTQKTKPDLKWITVSPDVHRRTKKRAAEIGLTISEFTEFALQKILKKSDKGK